MQLETVPSSWREPIDVVRRGLFREWSERVASAPYARARGGKADRWKDQEEQERCLDNNSSTPYI